MFFSLLFKIYIHQTISNQTIPIGGISNLAGAMGKKLTHGTTG
jgi:hypothetical protein